MNTPTDFKVSGPKGGVLIRHAKAARVAKALPGLVRRFKRVTVTPAAANARERARAIMLLLLQNERKVHYAQVRPMRTATIATLAQLAAKIRSSAGVTLDCSESATLICRLAGIADPNGLGYDGTGWTGTLISHLTHVGHKITAKQAQVADLVVFGSGGGHHVCTVLEPGADPLLFSHGQERGPMRIRFSEERKYQPSPAQFFRVV